MAEKITKDVLMAYRKVASITEFEVEYKKHLNDNVILVAENDIHRNLCRLDFKESDTFRIVTTKELIKGEIDNMKFNYAVGNPPFQHSEKKGLKIYDKITAKIFSLLEDDGKMSFITPVALLKEGKQNNVLKKLKPHITSIDFDVDDMFDVGQKVLGFGLDKAKVGITYEVTENHRTIVQDDLYRPSEKMFFLISKKVRGEKLPIHVNSTDSCQKIRIEKEKTEDFCVPVYCNTIKQRIQYINKKDDFKIERRLIIPYVGRWYEGSFIDTIHVKSMYVSNRGLSEEEMLNIKSFLETKLVAYLVVKYSDVIYPLGYFDYLSKLPNPGLHKSWTDEEIYEKYNLSDREISEVEEWYTEWEKTWKK